MQFLGWSTTKLQFCRNHKQDISFQCVDLFLQLDEQEERMKVNNFDEGLNNEQALYWLRAIILRLSENDPLKAYV